MERCTDSEGGLALRLTGFVSACEQPTLLDLGEEPLRLRPECWSITDWNGRAVLQAWDDKRNLVRKVTGVKEQRRDRMILFTERFPRTAGEMQIWDMAAPGGKEVERRGAKTAFRERLRRLLAREFPAWRMEDLSSEPDLEQSLSPSYIRGFLTFGSGGMAVIAAPPDCADPAGVVAFGLIWLEYLRRREPSIATRTLLLFVEKANIRAVNSRVHWLRKDTCKFEVYLYDDRDRIGKAEEWSDGNSGAALPPCRRPEVPNLDVPDIPNLPSVDRVEQSDGSLRFQVRGLEFARWTAGNYFCGIGRKRRCKLSDIVALARELNRVRSPQVSGIDGDRHHPLYTQAPEGWMESQVRADPQAIYAGLLPVPLYGQIPFPAGIERGIADLLGVDTYGRLAVLELKASADIQLPFQALDYWMKIRRHLEAGDFERQGYFPGIRLLRESPRIFLVGPALDFHSTSETVLSFFDPSLEIHRVGLAADWRNGLRVMFRLQGAERPT